MQGETTLAIAADHPAFAGHFPGMPILPGVVLLDAAVHALLVAEGITHSTGSSDSNSDSPASACRISAAKFLSPVGPGETLTISYRTSATGSTHFEISGVHRKVAEGTLMLQQAS